MLVGIDASRAVRLARTGTEWYSFEVIRALLRRPTPTRYRLYFDRDPGATFPRSDRLEERVIRLPRLWTHFRLSAEIVRHPPDRLFVPSHVIPLVCPVPAVATIHDVGYLWYREAYSPLRWTLLHLGTLWNVRAARRLVVDSEATARDLTTHFGVAPERLRVAYLGGPEPRVVDPSDVLARYALPPRYLLFVGTLQPRKNLNRALRAFAIARQATRLPLALVLAGQPGRDAPRLRGMVAALGLENDVRWLGYVPDADRPALFAGATAFVFPSLYEGFGLPALEAMAWGTPVLASSAGSLPEVVGDAGLLVDPYDVDELARAMERLLDDAALRERLIEAGRRRAATFTWERCAATVEAVIQEAG